MITAYNPKLKETPFYDNLLIEESTPPGNIFSADLATIDRIKSNSHYWLSNHSNGIDLSGKFEYLGIWISAISGCRDIYRIHNDIRNFHRLTILSMNHQFL